MANSQNENAYTYTRARFWKCALQVNTSEYIKYRGKAQTLSEDEYNQQLLEASLASGINVIGLADHGSVNGLDNLRTLFTENDIVIFPGFEIASCEKIHFVCLFDENKSVQELERILGRFQLLDPNDGAQPSELSAAQLIDEVKKQDGFIYAAHCTQEKGLLKKRVNTIWQHKNLLAAQIPGSIEGLNGVEDDFYRKVFLNKNPDYRRERPMAAINATDIAKPDDISANAASCLIKMTKPCFTSFKQAFLDAGSRVRLNSEIPENWSSAIERIRFVGGFLDGVDIEISEHLNAVIGGRGTGKSTLLECIRFALDLQPFGKQGQAQHNAIIQANLGKEKGMVELTLRSAAMSGRKFTITRRYGDLPVVQDEEGQILPYQSSDLLPRIELYGQNEIYEMARESQDRNRLVERFLEDDHANYESTIKQALVRLKDNREGLLKALHKRAEIEDEVELLPKLQDQAQQFKTLGLDEKLNVVPKLEKEKQLGGRIKEEVDRLQEALVAIKDSLPETAFLSDQALEALPHAEILRSQREILKQLGAGAKQITAQFECLLKQAEDTINPLGTRLEAGILAEEQSLEKAFQDISASQGKTGRQIGVEYQALLQQIERIKPKKTAMRTRQGQIDELYSQRKRMLLELSEARAQRSSTLYKSIRKLNSKLKNKVQLTLKTEGNRKDFVDYLVKCNLEGVGSKRLSWVLEGNFSPSYLVDFIRQGDEVLKNTGLGITPSVAVALCRLNEHQLLQLEELPLPDSMEIELNVTHKKQEAEFRKISDLSTGQQCTAILHLLLLDNQDPLILDQPEDNLDNAFIADRIVAELRAAKISRQFLFATHNANIPVFGDAEWIGVMSVVAGKGEISDKQQGAIDLPVIQRLAADILEGGKSAFNQRREKYGFE